MIEPRKFNAYPVSCGHALHVGWQREESEFPQKRVESYHSAQGVEPSIPEGGKDMPKTVTAEYLAGEQKLKLDEPLEGVADHARVQVFLTTAAAPVSRPWLDLKGSLPKEAIEEWRSSLAALSAPDPHE